MIRKETEANYFRVGAFVLVGFGLIVFALLIFGSEKMLEREIYVETYLDESIQGVTQGSPVKYRGLQIGYVDKIDLTSDVYGVDKDDPDQIMAYRSIYAKIAITSKLFTDLSDEKVIQFLTHEVSQGLRVKLVTQGLTGVSYLEFNYVDPKNNPTREPKWKPKYFYIPGVKSTLGELRENAQAIMKELRGIDFQKVFYDFNTLVISLDTVVGKTEDLLDKINNPAIKTMNNLRVISDDLRAVTDRLKRKPSDIVFSSYPPPIDPSKL